jgi:O-antigen/teichoic acid export membrane protein
MTRPAFHSAWTIVGLSATAQFLAGIYAVMLPGMYLAKEVQFSGLVQGIAAAAGVVANLVLIPLIGVSGAAVSLVLSYAVLGVAQYVWSRYRGYLAVEYEWVRLMKFGFFYCVFAGITLWKRDLSLSVELAFSAGLLTLLPIVLYRYFQPAERLAIRNTVLAVLGIESGRTLRRA